VRDPVPTLPEGYAELLEQLKRTIAAARWQAQRVVNTELLGLYWRLGNTVLQRQREEGWGTRIIDRLATDLRAAFPEMRGLSCSNLHYMRQMAAAWDEEQLSNRLLDDSPGVTSLSCSTRSATRPSATGTRPPPPSTAGPATFCGSRS